MDLMDIIFKKCKIEVGDMTEIELLRAAVFKHD